MAFLFLLFLAVGSPAELCAEIFFPWKGTHIGALESNGWFGLVLAPTRDVVFAFRLRVQKEDQIADSADLFYLVSEVGPHSPDGQYARVAADLSLPFDQGMETPVLIKPSSKSNTLTLEWSRQDERTVIGRILAPKNTFVEIIHYFPWNLKGTYRLRADGQIEGQGGEGKTYHYLFWTNRPGESRPSPGEEGPPLSFAAAEDRALYFVAAVGEEPKALSDQIYRYKNRKTIDIFLRDEQARYQNKRARIAGLFNGAAEAVTANLFWMVLYQPDYTDFTRRRAGAGFSRGPMARSTIGRSSSGIPS
jgi:hypothetical protein